MPNGGRDGRCVDPLRRWQESRLGRRTAELRRSGRGAVFGAVVQERQPGTARVRVQGRWLLNFGSAEILALDAWPGVVSSAQRCIEEFGVGCGASRVYQYAGMFEELEQQIAAAVGSEDAVALNSTTTVHCGVLPSLTQSGGSVLIADRMAHNSTRRACELCQARGNNLVTFEHNDVDHLSQVLGGIEAECYPIVVVDSVYSMGGEFAPLAEIQALVSAHDGLLYVDDAHGTGIYGERGGGYVSEVFPRIPDNTLVAGSLSKAICGYGGFLACPKRFREFVECSAEGFVFNGPIPAPLMGVDIAGLKILLSPHYPDMRARLSQMQAEVRAAVLDNGFSIIEPTSHIVGIPMTETGALGVAKHLFDEGFLVNAAVFPAVRRRTGIVRVIPSLLHTEEDVAKLGAALKACGPKP